MARPLGEVAQAALQALNCGPMTAREMSERLRVPERTIKNVCFRLVGGGYARVSEWSRAAHARRPVALYALPSDDCATLFNSIWHR